MAAHFYAKDERADLNSVTDKQHLTVPTDVLQLSGLLLVT
jgi:hypothetical protein